MSMSSSKACLTLKDATKKYTNISNAQGPTSKHVR